MISRAEVLELNYRPRRYGLIELQVSAFQCGIAEFCVVMAISSHFALFTSVKEMEAVF